MEENEKSLSFREKEKNKRKQTASRLRSKRETEKEKWKSMISQTQFVNLPQEIIDDILSRLPAKSLLACKCVCKCWYSTISSPNFHKREYDSVLAMISKVFAVIDIEPGLPFYSIDDDKATLEAFHVPWDKENVDYDNISVSNSCNGLVLLRFGEFLFLFNPSTHQSVKVLELDYSSGLKYGASIGLCYDESINDYKAIIGVSQKHHEISYNSAHNFALVASLKEKLWTEVSFPFEVYYTCRGPLVDGRLYWTAYDVIDDNDESDDDDEDDDDTCDKIIYFDPYLNVFEVLPSPPPKCGCENAIVGLGVLGGQLCMARRDYINDLKGNIEVWAMKKDGLVESWTTMFVVSNLYVDRNGGGLDPLLITKNGEVLFSINSADIIAYNPAKRSYREFEILKSGHWLSAVSLVQSKVSLLDYEWD